MQTFKEINWTETFIKMQIRAYYMILISLVSSTTKNIALETKGNFRLYDEYYTNTKSLTTTKKHNIGTECRANSIRKVKLGK